MYGHAPIIVKLCPACPEPTPGLFVSETDPLTLLCVDHAMSEVEDRPCAAPC